ncbi:MAG: hypothetical protein AB7S61_02880 [Methanoregulaceae archaeon]
MTVAIAVLSITAVTFAPCAAIVGECAEMSPTVRYRAHDDSHLLMAGEKRVVPPSEPGEAGRS